MHYIYVILRWCILWYYNIPFHTTFSSNNIVPDSSIFFFFYWISSPTQECFTLNNPGIFLEFSFPPVLQRYHCLQKNGGSNVYNLYNLMSSDARINSCYHPHHFQKFTCVPLLFFVWHCFCYGFTIKALVSSSHQMSNMKAMKFTNLPMPPGQACGPRRIQERAYEHTCG